MNQGQLTLKFTETVDVSSIQPSSFVLQKYAAISDEYFQLTSSDYSGAKEFTRVLPPPQIDADTVIVQLSWNDLNSLKVKFADNLCTSKLNTYMSVETPATVDMANNPLTAIRNSSAQLAANYVEDTTDPVLRNFDIDLQSEGARGIITLSFSETIDVSTIRKANIGLRNNNGDIHNLMAGDKSHILENDSHIVIIRLNSPDGVMADLNTLKQKKICTKSGQPQDCSIILPSETMKDMSGNDVAGVSTLNPQTVSIYVDDDTPPRIIGYGIDMSKREVTFSFSETMDAATLNPTQVIAIPSLAIQETPTYQLKKGIAVTNSDGVSVTLRLDKSDVDAMNMKDYNLWREQSTSWVQTTTFLIRDMSGNRADSFVSNQYADPFNPDKVRPELDGFDLDMNTGRMALYFSEVVAFDSFDSTSISLCAALCSTGEVPISSIDAISGKGLDFQFPLSGVDLELIKADLQMASKHLNGSMDTASLTLKTSSQKFLILDLAQVPNEAGSVMSMKVSQLTPDGTKPKLEVASLDLNVGEMKLSFDEPINVETFSERDILFNDLRGPSFGSVTLTSTYTSALGNVLYLRGEQNGGFNNKFVSTDASDSVIILLSEDDRKAFNLETFMRKFAYESDNSTYISWGESIISDIAGNKAQESTLQQASLVVEPYIKDKRNPTVTELNLDMNVGVLSITFDAPVDFGSFKPKGAITLHSSPNSETTYTLDGGSLLSQAYGYSLDVKITANDLNEIKQRREFGLAVDKESTFITITATLVDGLNYQDVVAITIPRKCSHFVKDTTAPQLESFSVDLTAETLALTFSETVNRNTLVIENVTLQNTHNALGSSTYQLSAGSMGGSTAIKSTANTVVVVLAFGKTDLNALKADTSLFIDESTSFVSLPAGAVRDMFDVESGPRSVFDAAPVDVYAKDETPPQLDAYTIDMNRGELLLTFSETVDRSSFDARGLRLAKATQPNQFELLNSKDVHSPEADDSINSGNNFQFTGHAGLAQPEHIVLVMTVTPADLNEIKRLQFVLEKAEVGLFVKSATVQDMVQLSIDQIGELPGKKPSLFVRDESSPIPESFALDLNEGILEINFDETVDGRIENIVHSKIGFTSLENSTTQHYPKYMLQYTPESLLTFSTTARLKIHDEDIWAIKLLATLATGKK
jgi:hypothetical protein